MITFTLNNEGLQFESSGDSMKLKLQGDDTDGQFTFIEDTIKANGFQSPLHLHRFHSEILYVIEGEITFRVGEEILVGGPGSTVYIPANTPHQVKSAGAGKMVTIFNPAGIDKFMKTMAALSPEQATPQQYKALMEQYDVIVLGH